MSAPASVVSRTSFLATSLCIAILGLLPITPLSIVGSWHDGGRMLQVFIFMTAAPLAANLLTGPASGRLRWAVVGLASLLLVCSCLHSATPSMAVREVLTLGGFGLLATATAHAFRNDNFARFIEKGVVVGAGLHAGLTIALGIAALLSHIPLDDRHLIIGFDNPRFLNHAQTVMLPLLAGVSASTSIGRPWRAAATLALAGQSSLLLLTLGRATSLSLVIALGAACLLFGRHGRRWATHLLAGIALGGVVYMSLFQFGATLAGDRVQDTLNAESSLDSDHSRLYLWRIALDDIRESPLWGIGPMHFAHHPNHGGAHPHNFYLQLAAEFGLPLALLAIGVMAAAMLRRMRDLRANPDIEPMTLAAFLACFAASVDACFSGNMVMPISQLWIALAVGMAFASPSIGHDSELAAVWSPWRIVASTLIALLYAGFAVNTAMGWYGRHVESATPSPSISSEPLRPRFWLDGWF